MSTNNQADQSRRKFLGNSAAVVAGVTIAPGILLHTPAQARPVDQAASNKQRWGILIDTNQCDAGCDKCVTACQSENGWGKSETKSSSEQVAQWIRKVELKDPNTGHQQSLPVMCQHCEHPPCVDVCPTGASMKREDGIVLVDKHICIGCRYCMMACPYKARSFIHEEIKDQKTTAPRGKGTVESCTMCVNRVDAGGTPACVESCPGKNGKAMVFGDLNDPESEIAKRLKQFGGKQIRADLGLNPGVRYQGI